MILYILGLFFSLGVRAHISHPPLPTTFSFFLTSLFLHPRKRRLLSPAACWAEHESFFLALLSYRCPRHHSPIYKQPQQEPTPHLSANFCYGPPTSIYQPPLRAFLKADPTPRLPGGGGSSQASSMEPASSLFYCPSSTIKRPKKVYLHFYPTEVKMENLKARKHPKRKLSFFWGNLSAHRCPSVLCSLVFCYQPCPCPAIWHGHNFLDVFHIQT